MAKEKEQRTRLYEVDECQVTNAGCHQPSALAEAAKALFNLATSRPPTTLPLYDTVVRLHLATTSFGRLRLSVAFVHPCHRLLAPAVSAATTHLCRVYARRFCALLRHFNAIHAHEHTKRLSRIDSSRGGRRVTRELTVCANAAASTPADEIGRAGVRVALTRTPAASLWEHAQQVLDEGSGKDELASLLRVARERGVRSVVVGGESGLARWVDVGFS
nr:uncharacterized protein LOC117856671 [Setaria viridis]